LLKTMKQININANQGRMERAAFFENKLIIYRFSKTYLFVSG